MWRYCHAGHTRKTLKCHLGTWRGMNCVVTEKILAGRCEKQQNICYNPQQHLLLAKARIIPPQFLCHAGINSGLTRNNPLSASCIYALVSAKQCVSAGETKGVQGEYQRCSGIAAGVL